jgi:quinol-cytochrome oxidoreductase complex cytochrome b subunit
VTGARPATGRLGWIERVVLGLLALSLAVLAVSGVVLSFRYSPTPPGVARADLDDKRRLASDVRTVHQLAGFVCVVTAGLAALLPLLPLLRRARARAADVVHGAALPLLAIVAAVSGLFLRWDQIALFTVEVGADYDGYEWLLDDGVRFVLLSAGGGETSVGTLLTVLAIHAALGVALLVLVGLAVRRWRSPAIA